MMEETEALAVGLEESPAGEILRMRRRKERRATLDSNPLPIELPNPPRHQSDQIDQPLGWEGHWQRHFERAKLCIDQHQHQLAIALLRRVIRQNEDHIEAWYLLGFAFSELKRRPQAIECFDRVVQLAPQWSEGWANRGWNKLWMRDPRGAVKDLVRAVEIQPHSAVAFSNLGLAYLRLKQIDKAAEAFEQAAKSDPNSELYAYRLARCLAKAGDREGSVRWLRRTCEISPTYLRAWIALAIRARRLSEWPSSSASIASSVLHENPENSPNFAKLLKREQQPSVTRTQAAPGIAGRLRPLLQNPLAWIGFMVLAALVWALLGN